MTHLDIEHYAGAEFDTGTFQILENGAPLSLTGLTVELRFWTTPGVYKLVLASGSGLTHGGPTGTFTVDSQTFALEARAWSFDIRTYRTSDRGDPELRAGGILRLVRTPVATSILARDESRTPTLLVAGTEWAGGPGVGFVASINGRTGYLTADDLGDADHLWVTPAEKALWNSGTGGGGGGAVSSVAGRTGAVVLTKADVGLGNVPNLDTSNPANITQDSTHRWVTDTEKASWAGKQDALGFAPVPPTRTVAGKALSADVALVKADVGLGNVDNTPDSAKPVSTAQASAIAAKEPTIAKSTGILSWTGSAWAWLTDVAGSVVSLAWAKLTSIPALVSDLATLGRGTGFLKGSGAGAGPTWSTLAKADVGLGNVDNTADIAKPVSTAQAAAIAAKQDALVSGTNIKTINGLSILGSGNLAVAGGGGGSMLGKWILIDHFIRDNQYWQERVGSFVFNVDNPNVIGQGLLRVFDSASLSNAGIGNVDYFMGQPPEDVTYEARIYFSGPFDGTVEGFYAIGFMNSLTAVSTIGAALRQQSAGNWLCVVTNNGTETTYDTGLRASIFNYQQHTFTIHRRGSDGLVEFYIDGVLLWTSSVALAPGGYSRWGFGSIAVKTVAVASSVGCAVDWVKLSGTLTGSAKE